MRMKSLWIEFLILKTAFRSKHRLKSLNLTFYVIGEVSLFVSFGHERERGQIGQFQIPEYSWIWLLTFSTFDRSIFSATEAQVKKSIKPIPTNIFLVLPFVGFLRNENCVWMISRKWAIITSYGYTVPVLQRWPCRD